MIKKFYELEVLKNDKWVKVYEDTDLKRIKEEKLVYEYHYEKNKFRIVRKQIINDK